MSGPGFYIYDTSYATPTKFIMTLQDKTFNLTRGAFNAMSSIIMKLNTNAVK
jgi:hypothetical protein